MLDEQAARVADELRVDDPTAPARLERFGSADAWLVRRGPERLILKRGRSDHDEADVTWEHDFLRRLAKTGFPASVPVPSFDGQCWIRYEGRIWATLSYLPGQTLAAEGSPDFGAAGAFLARYHRAARSVPVHERRPTEPGLLPLREITPPDCLGQVLGSAWALERFERLLRDLEAGLRDLHYDVLEHLAIHGDPTNDNLIVDGTPPRIVGLIDFGSSHLAPWPGDLAAALWRSARPNPSAIEYDPERVGRFVAGYHRESPIPPALARATPLLMVGRGLQLISRRVRRLRTSQPVDPIPDVLLTLRRAMWLHARRERLADVLSHIVVGEEIEAGQNG